MIIYCVITDFINILLLPINLLLSTPDDFSNRLLSKHTCLFAYGLINRETSITGTVVRNSNAYQPIVNQNYHIIYSIIHHNL